MVRFALINDTPYLALRGKILGVFPELYEEKNNRDISKHTVYSGLCPWEFDLFNNSRYTIQGHAILTLRKYQRVKFSGRYWLYTNANIGLIWQESQDRTYIKLTTVVSHDMNFWRLIQLECVLDKWLGLISPKYHNSALLALWDNNSLVAIRVPSQKASNAGTYNDALMACTAVSLYLYVPNHIERQSKYVVSFSMHSSYIYIHIYICVCVLRGQQHLFSTHKTDVLVNVSKFFQTENVSTWLGHEPLIFGFLPNGLTIRAIGATYLLPDVFEYWLWWYKYFCSQFNIRNVNYAKATAFMFDARSDVLVKVSRFFNQKISQPSDSCQML